MTIGIAGRVGGLGTWTPTTRSAMRLPSGDQATVLPVVGSGLLVPVISARKRALEPSGRAIARSGFVADATAYADPLAVGRPVRVPGWLLPAPMRVGLAVGQRHHPELAVRTARAVVVLDGTRPSSRRVRPRRRTPTAASADRCSAADPARVRCSSRAGGARPAARSAHAWESFLKRHSIRRREPGVPGAQSQKRKPSFLSSSLSAPT